jgi:hypothetical protein
MYGISFLPYLQFVDVGVEDPVHKADTRRLVRVLIRQLDVDFPHAALERSCISGVVSAKRLWLRACEGVCGQLTFCGTLELDKEFLPAWSECIASVSIGVAGDVAVVGWAYTAREVEVSCVLSEDREVEGGEGPGHTVVIDQSHLIVAHQPTLRSARARVVSGGSEQESVHLHDLEFHVSQRSSMGLPYPLAPGNLHPSRSGGVGTTFWRLAVWVAGGSSLIFVLQLLLGETTTQVGEVGKETMRVRRFRSVRFGAAVADRFKARGQKVGNAEAVIEIPVALKEQMRGRSGSVDSEFVSSVPTDT